MKKALLSFILLISISRLNAQFYQQYFDGSDLDSCCSVFINADSSMSNLWQIGPPQKIVFESASTVPNVLVTDTINYYPDSVDTYVWFEVPQATVSWGVGIAIQWNQKLDLDTNKDGGLVEFSVDSGATWLNAFTDPTVYTFYGFNPVNHGTIPSGDECFTGTDTLWRNIWLCFNYDFSLDHDNLSVRFRVVSDSIQTYQEGWMIDNLNVMPTWFHPVAEISRNENFKVYPTIVDRSISIEIISESQDFSINQISIVSETGQVIEQPSPVELKSHIETGHLSPGKYWLRVETNLGVEMHEFIVAR